MEKYIVLYNSKSDNGKGRENANDVKKVTGDAELDFNDLIQIEDTKAFFLERGKKNKFILTGGDGTLNYFINHIDEKDLPENLFYYPSGTGNDFYRDATEKEKAEGLINLNKYIVGLPTTTINGKTYKFLNNVGFGIDGYCCEVADIQKAKSDKPINYTGIAVKGLLFYFKPRNAKVTIDGVTKEYKHVWLAPVMKGKYYGGGMIPCPEQNRNGKTLSCLVWHSGNKMKTLVNFAKIFEGKHLEKKKMCEVFTGSEFVIEFAKPCAAQIDGETILNVTKVEVKA